MTGQREAGEGSDVAPVSRRRVPAWLWCLAPAVVVGLFAWQWWQGSRVVVTDNAYVRAGRVLVAPQVAGRVVEVAVGQNQPVRQGELLFRLDSEAQRIALAREEALLERLPLEDRDGRRLAEVALAQARLELARTEVRAPVDGIVATHDLQAGEYLQLGQTALPLVLTDGAWVEANFKETQLGKLQVGQVASIRIDSYPGQVWQARVVSIAPASGAEFSVLPPQNASGNWVKVVQRFPVRLEFEGEASLPATPLRAGLSAEVEVALAGGAAASASSAALAGP